MRWRNIELFVVCVFLLLTIVEFIQVAVQIRIFGPNLLHPRIWQYLVLFVILVGNPRAYQSKAMLIVYIYTLLYVLLALVGHYLPDRYWIVGTSPLKFLQVGWAVVVLLREHYFRPEMQRELRIVLKVAWLGFIVACLTSLYVVIRYPGAVRGAEIEYIEEDVRSYRSLGMGGYGFISSLPFMIPILYYFFRDSLNKKKRQALFYWLLVLLFLYTSYKGVIIAPFIIAVAIVLLSVLGRKRFRSSLIVMLVLVLIFTVLPNSFIGEAFIGISEIVPNRDMSQKFRDLGISYITGLEIVSSAEGSGNTVEHRASRVAVNLEQFAKHPLFGAGTPGNPHLFWLNQLAHFGLVGFFPLAWLLVTLLSYMRRFDDEFKFYYLLSVLAYVVLLMVKASGGYHFLLAVFFIAPGSYYLTHEFPQPAPVVAVSRSHARLDTTAVKGLVPFKHL